MFNVLKCQKNCRIFGFFLQSHWKKLPPLRKLTLHSIASTTSIWIISGRLTIYNRNSLHAWSKLRKMWSLFTSVNGAGVFAVRWRSVIIFSTWSSVVAFAFIHSLWIVSTVRSTSTLELVAVAIATAAMEFLFGVVTVAWSVLTSSVTVSRIRWTRIHVVAVAARRSSTASWRSPVGTWLVVVTVSSIGATGHREVLHRAHAGTLKCT